MPETIDSHRSAFSRREFLANASLGLAATALASQMPPAAANAADAAPASASASKPISLPPMKAKTEQQSGPLPAPLPPSERVGFAVVGLGELTLGEILPAFAASKKARLAALVSGSPEKAAEVARQYGLPPKAIYDYKTYDNLRDNPDVQAIYIVLPNSMHAEYTVRGAQAGKHILCEKPMANSVAECEQMIAACEKASRHLMIAYRIQYEPHNRLARKILREKHFGAVKLIESVNGQNQGDPNQWRQKKVLAGGGSLPDVGIYCLNTTRFLLGEEPEEVSAMIYSTPGDPRFKEVEENVIWQMRFPSGVLSNNATGYGFHESRRYRVYAETGWFGMDPAFSYKNLRLEASRAEDMLERRGELVIAPKDQFALELDHMADCVLGNRKPYTPGEEGLQDQRIVEAIYQSAATGKPIKLASAGAAGKLDIYRGPEPTAVG